MHPRHVHLGTATNTRGLALTSTTPRPQMLADSLDGRRVPSSSIYLVKPTQSVWGAVAPHRDPRHTLSPYTGRKGGGTRVHNGTTRTDGYHASAGRGHTNGTGHLLQR
jgi:hypothetical protein